jgi:hypothetical protein
MPMSRRTLASSGPLLAMLVAASGSLAAQSSAKAVASVDGGAKTAPAAANKKWTPPRTPWGDPDLQGTWDYRTITPLERPANMAGRQYLTDEEKSQLETRAAKRLDEPPDESVPANTVHAPYWTDPGRKVLDDRRTSLIVDPADGRIPPLTAEAQQRAMMRRPAGREGGRVDGPEDRSSLERCITWGLPTANLPGLYNNNIQIVQAPGYVTITHEMVHDTRVIPLDGRSHLSAAIRQWFGDSRGRWEGDTLVVETTNFSDKTNYRGSGANLRLVERFKRVDTDAIGYELTVDDPTTWVRSWTAAFPMRPSEGPIYEYACHEANMSLMNMLEVARDEEKALSQSKKLKVESGK